MDSGFSFSIQPATLLKKRFWYRCFTENFANFSKAHLLKSISVPLLLEINLSEDTALIYKYIDLPSTHENMPIIA